MMGCCGFQTSGGVPSGGVAPPFEYTELEIDFSDEPNTDLVAGAHTIGGLPFQAIRPADSQLLALVAGSGLRYQSNGGATNTGVTASGFSAAGIRCFNPDWWPVLTAGPNSIFQIEMLVAAQSIVTNNPYFLIGFYGDGGTPPSSSGRMEASKRIRTSNVQIWRSEGNTVAGYNLNYSPNPDPDVLGVLSYPGGNALATMGYADAGAYPAQPVNGMNCQSATNSWRTSPVDAGPPVEGGSFFIAFATGGITADMDVTIERMRIRAWSPPT